MASMADGDDARASLPVARTRLLDRRGTSLAAFLIVAAVLLGASFGPRLRGEFVWDDIYLVEGNQALFRADGWRMLLQHDLWGPVTGKPSQLYHPVPMLSLWLQGISHTRSLVGFRLANLVLHGLCAGLLWLFIVRRGVGRAAALAAAAVFLVHPSVTEPVMWITGRHDTLGMAFILAAMLLWPVTGRGIWLRSSLAGLATAMAFLCKEQFVVLPVLLFVYTVVETRGGTDGPPGLRRWLVLLLPCAGVAAVLLWRAHLGIRLGSDELARGFVRLLACYASTIWHYGVQLVSFGNSATLDQFIPLGPWAAMGVLVILVALLVALARAWWREPARFALPLLGVSWFCLALVPVVAAVPQIGFYGNRYAYSPLGGLIVAAVGLLEPLAGRARGRLSLLWLAAGVALPAMLVLSTLSEAANWRSDLSLYQADLLRDPENGIAHYHYGYAVLRRRGCGEALPIFLAATRLAPSYARGWHNVAGCLENLGRAAEAVEPARRAVELEPDNARNQYNLAVALAARGDGSGATRALERCLTLEPSFKPAQELLGELGHVQSQP
jgi:hypothetical protein